jgi:hypothetical protein
MSGGSYIPKNGICGNLPARLRRTMHTEKATSQGVGAQPPWQQTPSAPFSPKLLTFGAQNSPAIGIVSPHYSLR